MKAKGILGAVFFAAIIFAAGYQFGVRHSIKEQDFGAGTMNGLECSAPPADPIAACDWRSCSGRCSRFTGKIFAGANREAALRHDQTGSAKAAGRGKNDRGHRSW